MIFKEFTAFCRSDKVVIALFLPCWSGVFTFLIAVVYRVHAFLEQWGLINYQVDMDGRPTAMGPPATSHFTLLADTPMGLQPVNPPKTVQPSAAKQIVDMDKDKDKKDDEAEDKKDLTAVGLRTDLYAKKQQSVCMYSGSQQFAMK